MIIKFDKYNESFVSDVIDYYKIFGPRSIIDRLLFDDTTNISRGGKFNKSQILEIIKQVVDFYYDEKDIKFIGSGFFGSVYQTSDETKVLKITTDNKEVSRAEKFRKLKVDTVVDYYDVREILINGKFSYLWAIILEKVEPLSSIEKSVWKSFKLSDSYIDSNTEYKSKNKFFKDNLLDTNLPSNIYEICSKITELIDKTIEMSKKYKIDFIDIHSDNIGKDKNGNYKFFDMRSEFLLDKSLKLNPIKIII